MIISDPHVTPILIAFAPVFPCFSAQGKIENLGTAGGASNS